MDGENAQNDRQFCVVANWKMNGNQRSVSQLCNSLSVSNLDPKTEVIIAVPSIYLMLVRNLLPCNIHVAGQNIYKEPNGAFTGEISANMLKDIKARYVLLGHSERRLLFKEDDDFIAEKMAYAVDTGLNVIGCVGESLEERSAGQTNDVISRQMCAFARRIRDWQKVVIAYEPIWAIGTGKAAMADEVEDVHRFLREWIAENMKPATADATRILYGGSVNATNSKVLAEMSDVDGFLVGGASLKPEFIDIINCRL